MQLRHTKQLMKAWQAIRLILQVIRRRKLQRRELNLHKQRLMLQWRRVLLAVTMKVNNKMRLSQIHQPQSRLRKLIDLTTKLPCLRVTKSVTILSINLVFLRLIWKSTPQNLSPNLKDQWKWSLCLLMFRVMSPEWKIRTCSRWTYLDCH